VNVDHYREVLLAERGRVTEALERLHADNALRQDEEAPESGLADTATGTLDRELDYTLEEASEETLREIDDAVARIDAGTYGVCISCGKPIDEERLEAMPWAAKCIECKRLEVRP
jgi:RNA polymerase-binding protein DksA